jgi:transcriptional regulator with XRE-family HTH domain
MKNFDRKIFLRRLGKWIRDLRKAKGLSQDSLTEEAGLARGIMSKIEGGNVDPRSTTLVRVAHALDVPPAKILEVA